MKSTYDVAVVGSGFAGSLMATIVRRMGHSVVLLESGRHPRFAIGESSTPLANLLLEELTTRYHLPRIAPLAKWGSWQECYPDVSCGLKRGFSFFHHSFGNRMETGPDRTNQLLVAASPHDRIADTHWYRAEVDELLVQEARREGVEYFDGVKLTKAQESGEWMRLEGTRQGSDIEVRARFVIDATGPKGFLHKALQLPEAELPGFPQTQALYTHFTKVKTFAQSFDPADPEQPPYSIDDAALHHVFEGGWIWVLRFNNGVTSAGVAALEHVARRFRFEEGAPAWERLLRELPSVQEQFAEAQPQRAFIHAPKVSFRSGSIVGNRWALLPSAAGFIDPLLSTGFPLAILGVARLGSILETDWQSERFASRLQTYAQQTDGELLAAARLIAGLYGRMDQFPMFSNLSLLYFAAASFSETARKLGKPELASSFLLHDHPAFGPGLKAVLDAQSSCHFEDLQRMVLDAIEPINIAGLGNAKRRNWYPVDAEDLLAAAGKVKSSRMEISSLLERSGFWNHGG